MSAENIGLRSAIGDGKTRRLRIAVLTRNFAPTAGGAERYAIAMVEQLALRHDITVLAQAIDHSWPGVAYKKISSPLKRFRWVNQLWFAGFTWWATRRGFDVVHSHENTWHGNVQTVHVMPVRHNLFKHWTSQSKLQRTSTWLRVLTSPRLIAYLTVEHFRYQPKPGRRVIVTSRMLQDVFTKCFPAAVGITAVVTPGIKLPAFELLQTGQLDARRLLGLPQTGACLLFVANDFKKKGLRTLLQALTTLPHNVTLAVVGGSQQTDTFKQQAISAGIEGRVFFLGALTDMAPAYKAATCLVHPTREDTFAMAVLEAMAFGLPVVVSSAAYCGISAMLQHQQNALLLRDPFDSVELSDTIASLLHDEILQAALREHARSFAEIFDWPGLALQQEAIYFSCAKPSEP